MARRRQRGGSDLFHKSKGHKYSSQELLAEFDDSMTSPEVPADSVSRGTTVLYNQHKHPGEFTRDSFPSIKKRRTGDCTDLTVDCDEDESPHHAHQRPVNYDPLTHPHQSSSRKGGSMTRKISDFAQSVRRPLQTSTRSAALRSQTSSDYTPSMESSLPTLRSRAPAQKRPYQTATEPMPNPAHYASDPTHCTISTFDFSNTSSRPSLREASNRVASVKVGGKSSYGGGGNQSPGASDDVFIVEQEDSGGRNASGRRTLGREAGSPNKSHQVQSTAQLQKAGSVHSPGTSTHRDKPRWNLRGHSGEWDDRCLGLENEVSVAALEPTGPGDSDRGDAAAAKLGSKQQPEVQTLSDEEEEGLSAVQMVSAGIGPSGGNDERSRADWLSSEGAMLSVQDDIAEVVREDSPCEYVRTTSEYFEPPGAGLGSRGSALLQPRGAKGRATERAVTDSDDEFTLELEREDTKSPAPVSDDKPEERGRSVSADVEISSVPDSQNLKPPVVKDCMSPVAAGSISSTVARADISQFLSPDSSAILQGFKKSCDTFDESSQRQFVAPPTAPPPHSSSTVYGSRLRSSDNRMKGNVGLNEKQSIASKVGAKSDGQKRAIRLRGANGSHSSGTSSASTAGSKIEVEFDFDQSLSSGGALGLLGRGGPVNPFAKKGPTKPRPSLIMHSQGKPQEQKKVDATSNSERTPAVPDDRQRRASDDDVIFQHEEGCKKYPLRSRQGNSRPGPPPLTRPRQDLVGEILLQPHRTQSPARTAERAPPPLTRRALSSNNSGRFYGSPGSTSYAELMVEAGMKNQKNKTVGDVFHNFRTKSLRLRKKDQLVSSRVLCVDPDYRKAGSSQRVRPRKLRPMPSRGHLDDLEDQETLELEVMHVQIGRLTDIRVIDSVKLGGSQVELNLDVEDKTHKMQFEMKDIKEWKMNLSEEPLVIFILLTSGKALQLSKILAGKFHLDSTFYSPGSAVLSERYLVFHFSTTPAPFTIVQLTETLDDWKLKYQERLNVKLDKEMLPSEATRLLEQVYPASPARTEGKLPEGLDQSLPGAAGMDGQSSIRRSSRLESKRQSQGGGRRGKGSTGGDPNKKLLTYQPTGSKLRIELTSGDLDCLLPGEYLNDRIIDFYLMYLWHKCMSPESHRKVHVFSSFFHNRLTDSSRDKKNLSTPERIHDRVRTWTRHVDLFDKDFIVLPVCDRAHWFVSVIVYPGRYSPEAFSEGTRSRARARAKKGRGGRGRRGRRKGKAKVKTPEGAIVLSSSSQDAVVDEGREGSVVSEDDEREEPVPTATEESNQRCQEDESEDLEVIPESQSSKPCGEYNQKSESDASDESGMNWMECEDPSAVPEQHPGSIPGALLQSAGESNEQPLARSATDESSALEINSEEDLLLLSNSQDEFLLLSNSQTLDGINQDVSAKQRHGSELSVESVDLQPNQEQVLQETVIRESSDDECPPVVGLSRSSDPGRLSDTELELGLDTDQLPSDDGNQQTEAIHPCIMVLDSLGVKRTGIIRRIRNYLTAEWKAKKPDLPPKDFDGMKPFYPSLPLQDNSSDCGVFLLEYVESLLTSLDEDRPLPSCSQEWAEYTETRKKREVIRDLIDQLSKLEKQQQGPAD